MESSPLYGKAVKAADNMGLPLPWQVTVTDHWAKSLTFHLQEAAGTLGDGNDQRRLAGQVVSVLIEGANGEAVKLVATI